MSIRSPTLFFVLGFSVVTASVYTLLRTTAHEANAQIQLASTAPAARTVQAEMRATQQSLATIHTRMTDVARPPSNSEARTPAVANRRPNGNVRLPRFSLEILLGLVVLLIARVAKWNSDRKIARHAQKIRQTLSQQEQDSDKWPTPDRQYVRGGAASLKKAPAEAVTENIKGTFAWGCKVYVALKILLAVVFIVWLGWEILVGFIQTVLSSFSS